MKFSFKFSNDDWSLFFNYEGPSGEFHQIEDFVSGFIDENTRWEDDEVENVPRTNLAWSTYVDEYKNNSDSTQEYKKSSNDLDWQISVDDLKENTNIPANSTESIAF